MAETTAIGWTDATFNPVIGCTKVGPGCDHCYAEQLDKMRFSKTLKPLAVHWGPGAPRHRTSPANWAQPIKWNAEAAASGIPRRVFCASLADVFDNEWPVEVRTDLWALIAATPHLRWQLLTKRIGNVAGMVPATWMHGAWPAHVWMGATMVNQDEVTRDLPKLGVVPAPVRFVSYEPALGPVDWCEAVGIWWNQGLNTWAHCERLIDWLIVGGESGPGARPFDLAWARTAIRHCRIAGVPVFVKQLGAQPMRPMTRDDPIQGDHVSDNEIALWLKLLPLRDRAGADPAEWPEDLRVQEFPK